MSQNSRFFHVRRSTLHADRRDFGESDTAIAAMDLETAGRLVAESADQSVTDFLVWEECVKPSHILIGVRWRRFSTPDAVNGFTIATSPLNHSRRPCSIPASITSI